MLPHTQKTISVKRMRPSNFMLCGIVLCGAVTEIQSFSPSASSRMSFTRFREPSKILSMVVEDKSEQEESSSTSNRLNSVGGGELFDDFKEGEVGLDGVMIDDLNWRVDKLRLEEENKRRFLKARPRFLPYEECCKWVQAFGRWSSEEDWNEWIAMGEKRNAYIPSRPDEYYGRLGKWISWDHFLGIKGSEEDDKGELRQT